MDTETTGLDPFTHEIVQLAIIPLDSNIEVRKDVMPFHIKMKPDFPNRIDPEAFKVSGHKLEDLMATGFDKDTAMTLLEDWIQKLGLPVTASGRPKKIIPLGQNYAGFDKFFMIKWLGHLQYNEWFDYHLPDTMSVACYLNDRAAMRAEKVPFSKINLTYLASTLKIPHDRAHDALQDALMASRVYQRMLKMGSMWE
jgi:DNA polymerase III epsilon subunit-like protein